MNICANRQNTLKNSNEIKYSMKITTFSSYKRHDKHKKKPLAKKHVHTVCRSRNDCLLKRWNGKKYHGKHRSGKLIYLYKCVLYTYASV